MGSLFSDQEQFERLPLQDAEVYYLRQFLHGDDAITLMRGLIDATPWRAEKIVVWGKSYLQPRLIAWYGDGGASYTYSGIRLDPLPWTSTLLEIRTQVQAITSSTFNSVLLNYYRDHRDSMGLHSDDEPELGPQPTIASVSLGEERTFVMKHKKNTQLKPVRLKLESGSLLLMKGNTQQNWKHGIDKEKSACGPRVNLTFRRILA